MAMGYEEFITTVEQESGLAFEEAERAARAALKTLGERLSGGEARDLAERLPEPLRPVLSDGEQPDPFGVDEYLHRVARREGVDETDAARHALAVFTALGRAAGLGEVRDMAAELPKDFRLLLVATEAAARAAGERRTVPVEALAGRVAEATGLDGDAARRAADAVLDALGERLSAGQVADLAGLLGDELARALRRGDARSKGEARAFSLTEFVRRVADREQVAPAQAREHARAVLAVLRDAVGEKEFSDTLAQLPDEYRALLDGAAATPQGAPGTPDGAGRSHAGRAATRGEDGTTDAPATVSVHAPKDLAREDLDAARDRLASLQRHVGRPILSARLTLRHPQARAARSRWIADASIDVEGRVLAAHATGAGPLDATDAVVDRLRRQLRRVADREVALRNEPRVIARALRELAHEVAHRPDAPANAPSDRRIVHRTLAADRPASTVDAVVELLDADQEFRLFRHERTGEWLAVHRRDDERIGLIHPPWVPLPPDEASEVIVPEPSPFPEPVPVDGAQAELVARGRRFVYFVDAADGRPKILYLRHDGDYGLVEPAV